MDDSTKRDRFRRFWQPLEKGEGGYLAVISPIDDSGLLPYKLDPPADLHELWMSTEYRVKKAEADAQNTFWGQDAVQTVSTHFGAGAHAALLGAPYELRESTVWFDLNPPIKSWDKVPDLKTNRDHEIYKAIDAHTRALCAASKGRYAVPVTDIGGQYDVLFSLRGEELLSDFLDYPDKVLAAQAQLDDLFIDWFDELCGIIEPTGCGYTGWIPTIHDDPWYPLQCDMSVMISPKMFEKFVLPSVDKVSTAIGQSIFHLDGPGQFRHLDMLLSLKYIHAIQWVPLPDTEIGNPDYYFQDFADELSLAIYKKTLAAGKKLALLGVWPHQIPVIYNEVGTDGVFIQTVCKTRKEADDLIDCAKKNWIKV